MSLISDNVMIMTRWVEAERDAINVGDLILISNRDFDDPACVLYLARCTSREAGYLIIYKYLRLFQDM